MRETLDDKNNTYNKIKHLVEVDDDILAVFTIISSQIRELYIAKNSKMDGKYVDLLVNNLGYNKSTDIDISTEQNIQDTKKNLLGNLKWEVLEYDEMRILKIYEPDKIIFVLINSNTQLEHTVDNILGYYYESEELPKSLF
ncbi:hypothetical protein YTPLAS21_13930 [Candidatus Nitrosocosmicus sp.]|nr:hypothetical protein YTPLAS21_13930 [Candidatus Nitrosocosmicus sp.]